ncbi:18153_t:CDS:1, partial [Gigaspora rosea]
GRLLLILFLHRCHIESFEGSENSVISLFLLNLVNWLNVGICRHKFLRRGLIVASLINESVSEESKSNEGSVS